MGILKAVGNAFGGTLADQWKDVITAGRFDEHDVVTPGLLRTRDNGRGSNGSGSAGVITNGSQILVPENTAAFIFSQSGIESIISRPGGYEYHDGQQSFFNGDGIRVPILDQFMDRIGYGGITPESKHIAFVNLREIRGITFGTQSPLMYNDLYYGTDLEILVHGSFTVKVMDPVRFVRNFVPANVTAYSFDDKRARVQILTEFLQSFLVALNSLSTEYRISALPAQANRISEQVAHDSANAGTWGERFGFTIMKVAIENIEFSPESRKLVQQFAANRMNLTAYEDVSQHAANIGAQQHIAEGVKDHGLGDGAGMLLGMNLAQNLNPLNVSTPNATGNEMQAQASQSDEAPHASASQHVEMLPLDKQLEALKRLKELLDAGILTQEEFGAKKREILGL
jgi:membrane protease subunit (stomatin/prohibitin family)